MRRARHHLLAACTYIATWLWGFVCGHLDSRLLPALRRQIDETDR